MNESFPINTLSCQLHFAVITSAMITQTPKAKAVMWMHAALIISRLETDTDYVINLWRLNWHWRRDKEHASRLDFLFPGDRFVIKSSSQSDRPSRAIFSHHQQAFRSLLKTFRLNVACPSIIVSNYTPVHSFISCSVSRAHLRTRGTHVNRHLRVIDRFYCPRRRKNVYLGKCV